MRGQYKNQFLEDNIMFRLNIYCQTCTSNRLNLKKIFEKFFRIKLKIRRFLENVFDKNIV